MFVTYYNQKDVKSAWFRALSQPLAERWIGGLSLHRMICHRFESVQVFQQFFLLYTVFYSLVYECFEHPLQRILRLPNLNWSYLVDRANCRV